MVSDEALLLLDGMVELQTTTVSNAATSQAILVALDFSDESDFRDLLQELIDQDYVRARSPKSIREIMAYYVNMPKFEKLLKSLDPDGNYSAPISEPNWSEVKQDIQRLEKTLENADLSQAERAQAGAIVSSLRILIEAPDPPKAIIRNLLYDLAALATLFAFAIQIAQTLR